jgi:hypothetical protein
MRASKYSSFGTIISLAISVLPLIPSSLGAQGGIALWTNYYNGTGNGDDTARTIALDAQDNVYVSGYSLGIGEMQTVTIKYKCSGEAEWTNRFVSTPNISILTPLSLAVDPSGDVIVASGIPGADGYDDFGTLKYSSAGLPLWTNRYSYGQDVPDSVALDKLANVYVAGGIGGFVTLKYSSDGQALWTNRFNLSANRGGEAIAIAVDSDTGTAFVTGISSVYPSFYSRCVTLAYSSSGVPLWTNLYAWKSNSDDSGRTIAFRDGTVIVGGFSDDHVSEDAALILAYSTNGQALWTNRYGPGISGSSARQVCIDRDGSVLIGGWGLTANTNQDFLLLKYSAGGNLLWSRLYDGPGLGANRLWGMTLDRSGNIIVTGESAGAAGPPDLRYYLDLATIAYSPSGTQLWVNQFNGAANGEDSGSAVATARDGSVYVTGRSHNGTNLDFVTIKYSAIPPPQIALRIEKTNNGFLLSWANSAFALQSAPSATGTFTNIPAAVSPYTNSASHGSQFFRLISN